MIRMKIKATDTYHFRQFLHIFLAVEDELTFHWWLARQRTDEGESMVTGYSFVTDDVVSVMAVVSRFAARSALAANMPIDPTIADQQGDPQRTLARRSV